METESQNPTEVTADKDPSDDGNGGPRLSFLLTGIACLDIVNICSHYPAEDADLRAVGQEWRRGGNSSNSACVLSQLPGTTCSLLATVAKDGSETEFVEKDLTHHSVDLQYVVRHEGCRLPTSYVVLSQSTGSRTIVHYRNLPNLTAADFEKVPLENFSWIHFEGRNVEEVTQMLAHAHSHRQSHPEQSLMISVEVEKTRPETYPLMALGDVVFVSSAVAKDLGCHDAKSAVLQLHSRCKKDAKIVCAWGSAGADAYSLESGHVHCDAFPPPSVVDTLAAGDTFNAGLLFGLGSGASLPESVRLGCWLAGRKCGQMGVDNLLAGMSESDPVHGLLKGIS